MGMYVFNSEWKWRELNLLLSPSLGISSARNIIKCNVRSLLPDISTSVLNTFYILGIQEGLVSLQNSAVVASVYAEKRRSWSL